MPDELSRVIARMLDGLRPAQSQPRGRPLQQFISANDHMYLQEDGSSGPTETAHSPYFLFSESDTLFSEAMFSGPARVAVGFAAFGRPLSPGTE